MEGARGRCFVGYRLYGGGDRQKVVAGEGQPGISTSENKQRPSPGVIGVTVYEIENGHGDTDDTDDTDFRPNVKQQKGGIFTSLHRG